MAEDTSNDGAADEPSTEVEAPAPEVSTGTEPSQPTPAPDKAGQEDGEGLDPQLIVLCVLLWIAAMGLFVFKWQSLRADWYLGDIMEAINLRGDLDQEAMDQLAAMGPSVVQHLKEEVHGANFNRDEIYRVAVVKILERIEGEEALGVLLLTAKDVDPRVRANTYISLKVRALEYEGEREAIVEVLIQMAQGEPEPVARSFAVEMLDELGALDSLDGVVASWPFLQALRDARGEEPVQAYLRESTLKALRLLSKQDAEALPFDNDAAPEIRDEQARAWEEWYRGAGGEVPEGQGWAEWKARLDAADGSDEGDASAPPEDGEDGDASAPPEDGGGGADTPLTPTEQGSE